MTIIILSSSILSEKNNNNYIHNDYPKIESYSVTLSKIKCLL
ncbi:Ser/Thr protein kinase [Xenorhabdus nematophila F1]|uniref:Ser/Thr protein kinase n=1 Tax=Xenorhabdus nematophila (strain ATCC 19061 / DSM 3370 / CCUG 14189 / LMG 1036 / NCIMB 9965 / AN6) TaxID=406817 RepID=D3VBK3_XENNA